jgi:hypothetical protein
MTSDGMIYISSFMKIGKGVQELGSLISLLSLFQNKESWLKITETSKTDAPETEDTGKWNFRVH